jgi:hypothetical protein
MTPGRRWLLLGALLLASLAAAWTASHDDEALVPALAQPQEARIPEPPRPRAPAAAPPQPAVRLDRLASRDPGRLVRDPFARPAIAARRPARAPAPQAPAAPFAYAGKYESGGDAAAFLTMGDQNLVVHQGDVIADTWRIERIGEDAVTVVYLPLDQPQTISIPEAQ